METEALQAFVGRIFVCPDDVAAQIVLRARLRIWPRQAVVLRQGEPLSHSYLLVLGRARALLYSADGQAILLHEYRAGDIFGAVGEPDAVAQEADVLAVEEVEALVIQASQLVMLAQQHGCIGLALSRLLLQRLRRTTDRMFERAALSSIGRVYAELLRQARLCPRLTISPAPVIADLALIVSTTRETASRAVSGLERRGIIRRDADALVVVAPHRLEELIL
jgi:CRP/FNR family transcriptional regulator, cyclic AMP receptor protein